MIKTRSNNALAHVIHNQYLILIISIFLIYVTVLTDMHVIAAEPSIQVTESTLVVPYSGPAPRGPLKFPLYKGEDFQYFSAGVGLEERQLTYPPYQLKLILVQGTRAFLSNVSVKIRQLDGPLTFDIPAIQVEGPWVFLKIPDGTYLITAANYQDKKIEKQVSVKKEHPQTVHLRW